MLILLTFTFISQYSMTVNAIISFMKTLILASASPRRRKLLEKAGLKFIIDPSGYKEITEKKLSPDKLVEHLSFQKAKVVTSRHKNSVIIAADTLIVCGGKILGKPKNMTEAKKMLKFLNGKMHYVITGFTVYDTAFDKFVTKSVRSKVYFNQVSGKEIENYIFSKKPFDKAGGYGIQELPESFVRKIVGDYANVIGLPINALLKELKKLGVKVL